MLTISEKKIVNIVFEKISLLKRYDAIANPVQNSIHESKKGQFLKRGDVLKILKEIVKDGRTKIRTR